MNLNFGTDDMFPNYVTSLVFFVDKLVWYLSTWAY